MKPSRELDTLVAEKVMKHKVFHDHGQVFIASSQKAFDRMLTQCELFWEGTKDESEYCLQLPFYSTDFAAAWTVDKPGWLWEFQEMPEMLTATLYTSFVLRRRAIEMYPVLPTDVIFIRRKWLEGSKAQTYAWLRCLVALEAVGMEVEDA